MFENVGNILVTYAHIKRQKQSEAYYVITEIMLTTILWLTISERLNNK